MNLDRVVMTADILSRLWEVLILKAEDGCILDANDAALSTYGYSVEQIRTLRLTDLWSPETQSDADACLRAAREHGGVFQAAHRRADGSIFTAELVSVPVVTDDTPALLVMVRNISEHEALEALLRESKAALQSILDNAPLLVCVTALDGRYTLANRMLETLLMPPGETMVGRLRADVMPAEHAEEHAANDRVVLASRLPATFEEPFDEPDGRHTYLSTRFPLFDDDGEIASVCSISADITDVKRVEAELADANTRLAEVVRETAAIVGRVVATRDPYTQNHEIRVAELAALIAAAMGLSDDEIEGVEMAALLHDIGKMCVPAEILSKPGPLSKEQFALVQCHPAAGYEILQGVDFPWPVAEAVLQHHERLDGSGYPQGLRGDETCVFARILAVADVVEAIASHRPYRPALGIGAAIEWITRHPDKYDQDVTAGLLSVYESDRMPW
jgi:PAS domain S-box-containing protein/putative nucleotidyltransferase with HDIG domain